LMGKKIMKEVRLMMRLITRLKILRFSSKNKVFLLIKEEASQELIEETQ